MTNEQLSILLQNIEQRLRREISGIENQLPTKLRRKPEGLPDNHPLKDFALPNREYFPCLLDIESFADELGEQASLLADKKDI